MPGVPYTETVQRNTFITMIRNQDKTDSEDCSDYYDEAGIKHTKCTGEGEYYGNLYSYEKDDAYGHDNVLDFEFGNGNARQVGTDIEWIWTYKNEWSNEVEYWSFQDNWGNNVGQTVEYTQTMENGKYDEVFLAKNEDGTIESINIHDADGTYQFVQEWRWPSGEWERYQTSTIEERNYNMWFYEWHGVDGSYYMEEYNATPSSWTYTYNSQDEPTDQWIRIT